MKYVITWRERPMGSAAEYETAQKRILSLFKQWKPPETVKILQFLVRVGEYGGYMVAETDNAAAIQKMTSTYPAFEFHVDPVLDVNEAVTAELEAIAWRDSVGAD